MPEFDETLVDFFGRLDLKWRGATAAVGVGADRLEIGIDFLPTRGVPKVVMDDEKGGAILSINEVALGVSIVLLPLVMAGGGRGANGVEEDAVLEVGSKIAAEVIADGGGHV